MDRVSMTNSTSLSNTFDDHFSTIGPKLACEIPLNNGPSFQEFKYLCMAFKVKDSKFIPTDSNQVLSLFKKLNKSKGAGPDGISSQLILLIVLI